MKFFRLFSLCLFMVTIAHAALAQDSRIVPDNRTQVQWSYAPLVKKVAPAVVNIYTKRTVTRAVSPFVSDPFFQQFFGGAFGGGGGMPGNLSRRMVENALGTGVIVDKDGLVVTNAHVVENADQINVVLSDGREFNATKKMVDKASDIAVLSINAGGTPLPYVTLEPSEKLEVGDLVLAIGNPFGVGQTVTSGIISALARSSLDINDYNFFIQTDAAINPGNSGGPLVAMDGGVIGINAAIYSKDGGSLGIGFAIPSEMVVAVLTAVRAGQTGERIARPWLGVTTQKVTPDIAESLGFTLPHGVLISALNPASPLRDAGAKVGDVITALNDHTINDSAEMKFRMATIPIGGAARIGVDRKGQTLMLNVKASPPPDLPARDEKTIAGANPLAGATVANINPAVSIDLGIARDDGVIVTKTDPRQQGAQLVERGDIIDNVNGVKISSVAVLQKVLEGAASWQITIDSHGQKRQMIIQ